MASEYQYTGADADLDDPSTWYDLINPGSPPVLPGTTDVAIIESGANLYGTLDVNVLDIVEPTLKFLSDTSLTAVQIGLDGDVTMASGSTLQGTTSITVEGTSSLVLNGAVGIVGNHDPNEPATLDIGVNAGDQAKVVVNGNGLLSLGSTNIVIGGAAGSAGTLDVTFGYAGDGYWGETSGETLTLGEDSGSTGSLIFTGSQSSGQIAGNVYDGIEGQGTIEVANGAYAALATTGILSVAFADEDRALLDVTGAGSELVAGEIDDDGSRGTVLVSNGGSLAVSTSLYVNLGTLSVTGAGSNVTATDIWSNPSAGSSSDIIVGAGATLDGIAEIYNTGTVRLEGGTIESRSEYWENGSGGQGDTSGFGTITAPTVYNDYIMAAQGGRLLIAGAANGTGMFQIGSAGTLEFDGSVAKGLKVGFLAGANTLALAELASFAAPISGFGAGDKIDLLDTAATKLTVAKDVATGREQVSVLDGTKTVGTLQFAGGTYTAANFALGSDGHGGSAIAFAT